MFVVLVQGTPCDCRLLPRIRITLGLETAVCVLVTRVHIAIIVDVSSHLSGVTDRAYCKSDDEEAPGGPHCRTVPTAVVVSYVRLLGLSSHL